MKHSEPQYGYWGTDVREYLGERKSQLGEFIGDARRQDNLVGFVGGPPCPDFSVGGKNKGQHGERALNASPHKVYAAYDGVPVYRYDIFAQAGIAE